jgi:hypothetical protein
VPAPEGKLFANFEEKSAEIEELRQRISDPLKRDESDGDPLKDPEVEKKIVELTWAIEEEAKEMYEEGKEKLFKQITDEKIEKEKADAEAIANEQGTSLKDDLTPTQKRLEEAVDLKEFFVSKAEEVLTNVGVLDKMDMVELDAMVAKKRAELDAKWEEARKPARQQLEDDFFQLPSDNPTSNDAQAKSQREWELARKEEQQKAAQEAELISWASAEVEALEKNKIDAVLVKRREELAGLAEQFDEQKERAEIRAELAERSQQAFDRDLGLYPVLTEGIRDMAEHMGGKIADIVEAEGLAGVTDEKLAAIANDYRATHAKRARVEKIYAHHPQLTTAFAVDWGKGSELAKSPEDLASYEEFKAEKEGEEMEKIAKEQLRSEKKSESEIAKYIWDNAGLDEETGQSALGQLGTQKEYWSFCGALWAGQKSKGQYGAMQKLINSKLRSYLGEADAAFQTEQEEQARMALFRQLIACLCQVFALHSACWTRVASVANLILAWGNARFFLPSSSETLHLLSTVTPDTRGCDAMIYSCTCMKSSTPMDLGISTAVHCSASLLARSSDA